MRNSSEELTGGAMVCRPTPIFYKVNQPIGITLMSDLHIGAPNLNIKLIQRELERAREYGDRININGDVLDLIITKDKKRFVPGALHSRLQGRNDIINAAVDWAVEILEPYADLIDMIGVGNHEAAVEREHSMDTTRMIVDRLNDGLENRPDHLIHYGGYCGFLDYRFRRLQVDSDERCGRDATRWVVFYHHGVGKSTSAATKGISDFAKLDMFVDADLLWLGHNHQRTSDATQRISCPQFGDNIKTTEIRHVRTGAYLNVYAGQPQASVKALGRRSNYAADALLTLGGQGGARVELTFTGDSKCPIELRVTQ